jgi:hypothetical protein
MCKSSARASSRTLSLLCVLLGCLYFFPFLFLSLFISCFRLVGIVLGHVRYKFKPGVGLVHRWEERVGWEVTREREDGARAEGGRGGKGCVCGTFLFSRFPFIHAGRGMWFVETVSI